MFDWWSTVQTARRVLQPTWLTLSFIVLVSGVLVLPQGRDVLTYVAEQGPLSTQSLALLGAALAVSACAWYFARALLYVEYWNTPPFEPWHLPLRRRYARVLGAVPLSCLVVAFALEGHPAYAAGYAVVTAAFLVLVVRRRRLFNLAALTTFPALPPATLAVLSAVLIASYVLLGVFLLSRVAAPRALGAAPVALLATASWIAFGSLVLIYPTYRFRLPSLAVIAVLATGLFSVWNDNHALRSTDDVVATPRPAPEDHFRRWWSQRSGTADPDPYPLVVIAADGGGIRAAYWTASVLARLEDESPGFGCHVFAISSVSGASLGSAVYAGLLAGLDDGCRPGTGKFLVRTRRLLGHDFLAPTLAGMLFPDLLQRFLPVSLLPDRATYLETAWEAPWRQPRAGGRAWMAEDFRGLWREPHGLRVPSLFLNGTWVNDGGRTAVSNLTFSRHHRFLTGLDDLLARSPHAIPLSTAAHASARFPYISPAGTVPSEPPLYVVDGGYYENSGAITAGQIVRMLHSECGQLDTCAGRMKLVALVISNDPGYPGGCTSFYDADKRRSPAFTETLTPPVTFWRTRSARGYDAECALRYTVDRLGGRLVRISLSDVDDPATRPAAPLGWMLSEGTRRRIDERVNELTVPPALRFD